MENSEIVRELRISRKTVRKAIRDRRPSFATRARFSRTRGLGSLSRGSTDAGSQPQAAGARAVDGAAAVPR
jgi:hypothetical protein